MKLAYYPGCSLETSAREYNRSVQLVSRLMGVELCEIPDWSCCGASAGHTTSRLLALALAARNLALAEETGLDMVAPCAACYQRLALARYELVTNAALREKVNGITQRPFNGNIRVKSIVEVLLSAGTDKINSLVVRPLKGLKVAAYYGCYLVRPRAIQIDDAENPQVMEKILRAAGAEVVDWTHKTECCGASLAVSNEDVAIPIISRILKAALAAGANCIACACPLCHFNLDIRQAKARRYLPNYRPLPVLYLTQLLGLAMGQSERDLGLEAHFIETRSILKMVG